MEHVIVDTARGFVAAREEAGLKAPELAQKMGYSASHINGVVAGRVEPTLRFKMAAAQALDKPVEVLFPEPEAKAHEGNGRLHVLKQPERPEDADEPEQTTFPFPGLPTPEEFAKGFARADQPMKVVALALEATVKLTPTSYGAMSGSMRTSEEIATDVRTIFREVHGELCAALDTDEDD